MKKISFLLILAIAIISCQDDNGNEPIGATSGDVNFRFSNMVGTDVLTLNTTSYTNGSAETYEVSELKYIISNIVFIDANGNEFVYPQANSYFVINEENASSKNITLTDVNGGDYTQVRFGFGVDQSNYPLNGINNFVPTAEELGMLWTWSAGYKFLKFEGTFDSATQTDEPFLLHIGSHGTTQDNYREITISLGNNPISVSESPTQSVNVAMDVAKIFDGTNTHSLEEKSEIQVDPVYAPILTGNMQSAFSLDQ